MPTHIARLAAALAAIVLALFLSACSSTESDGHSDHPTTDEPVITGEPAGFNGADVAFATNMIPHHQQAIDMAELVPERSTNPDLTALAEKIAAEQQPEINTLRVFLVQWNENPNDSTAGGGHAGHSDMQGMVDEATMARLQSLNGPAFDTLWLQSMIAHHEGAIEMAKTEIADGEHVDAKGMAQTIVDTQQAEIGQMKQMLEGGQNG